MKIKNSSFASFIFLSALALSVLAGCTTTSVKGSGIKGKSATVKTGKRIIADYQGATLGKEIPLWVEQLVEGQYSQQVLSKSMPGLENKKVFVTIGRGDNLEFVRTWNDLVDIETEVAGTLERVAGKTVEAEMKGNSSAKGNRTDSAELERTLNMYRASLVNVRLSGLERIASYWLEIQVLEKKKVVSDYYEYYSVWAMDENLFERQLEEAMSKVEETSTESQQLKNIVSRKLSDSVAISNDENVISSADVYVIQN